MHRDTPSSYPIERLISGGQSGVDRAALDVALDRGIPCGGWCPLGRLAEDGPIPARYPLRETPKAEYAIRTAWNVRDSEGTLILTWGPPTEGTAATVGLAKQMNRPHLIVDFACEGDPGAVVAWIRAHGIRTLNVAGPRASKQPGIYDLSATFLHRVLDALAE